LFRASPGLFTDRVPRDQPQVERGAAVENIWYISLYQTTRTIIHAVPGLHHRGCQLDILSNQLGRKGLKPQAYIQSGERSALRLPGKSSLRCPWGARLRDGDHAEVFVVFFLGRGKKGSGVAFAYVPFCLIQLCKPVTYLLVLSCNRKLRWP